MPLARRFSRFLLSPCPKLVRRKRRLAGESHFCLASRWSKRNLKRRTTRTSEIEGCAGLMRKFVSVGTIADGTRSTTPFPPSNQAFPKLCVARVGGRARQLRGRSEEPRSWTRSLFGTSRSMPQDHLEADRYRRALAPRDSQGPGIRTRRRRVGEAYATCPRR